MLQLSVRQVLKVGVAVDVFGAVWKEARGIPGGSGLVSFLFDRLCNVWISSNPVTGQGALTYHTTTSSPSIPS